MSNNIFVTRSSMPSLEEYVNEIKDIWQSHWLTNMGVKHQQLQKDLIDYMGVEKLDLVVNGHLSLELSLQALNLQGEVITTPFTFASTTHAIVGGVMGAGVAGVGFSIVNWSSMGSIVASWIISPLFGGIIAAGFLFFIKTKIIFCEDKITAANKFVPVLIAVMTWAFSTYLILKGLRQVIHIGFIPASLLSLILAIIIYYVLKPIIITKSLNLKNI